MAGFDPALRDLVAAMVGPAKVVAALLAERRRGGHGRRRECKSLGAVNNAECPCPTPSNSRPCRLAP